MSDMKSVFVPVALSPASRAMLVNGGMFIRKLPKRPETAEKDGEKKDACLRTKEAARE